MSFVSAPLFAALQAQYGATPQQSSKPPQRLPTEAAMRRQEALAGEMALQAETEEKYFAPGGEALYQEQRAWFDTPEGQEFAKTEGGQEALRQLDRLFEVAILPARERAAQSAVANNITQVPLPAQGMSPEQVDAYARTGQLPAPPPPALAPNMPGSQVAPTPGAPNLIGREAMNLPQQPGPTMSGSVGGRVSMPMVSPETVAQIPADLSAAMQSQTQTNIGRQADTFTRQAILADEAAQRKSAFTLQEMVPQLEEKAKLIRAQSTAIQRIQDETNAAVQGAMEQIEQGRQRIKANPVNMGRVFSGVPGTLAAIGAALATGVGEAVAIQTGRPNSQANLVMDLINRDVAGQEALLESERANIAEQYTAVGQLRQQGMDKQSARQAATLAGIDAVQAQIETLMTQFQGTEDVAGIQMMWEQLEQQKLQMQQDRMMQLYNAQIPLTDMRVRALSQRLLMEADAAAKQAELTVEGTTGLLASKDNRTEASGLVGAYHAIQPMLKQYVEILESPDKGGVEWSALMPGDPARIAMESQLTQLRAQVGAAVAGLGLKQQTKDEFEKLTSQVLPSPTDVLTSREAALEAARTALRNFENSSKAYMKPLMRGFTGFIDLDPQATTLRQQITGRQAQ